MPVTTVASNVVAILQRDHIELGDVIAAAEHGRIIHQRKRTSKRLHHTSSNDLVVTVVGGDERQCVVAVDTTKRDTTRIRHQHNGIGVTEHLFERALKRGLLTSSDDDSGLADIIWVADHGTIVSGDKRCVRKAALIDGTVVVVVVSQHHLPRERRTIETVWASPTRHTGDSGTPHRQTLDADALSGSLHSKRIAARI